MVICTLCKRTLFDGVMQIHRRLWLRSHINIIGIRATDNILKGFSYRIIANDSGGAFKPAHNGK